MSTSAAIAAVTQTLTAVLDKVLRDTDASFTVSALPLDRSNALDGRPNRLNVFLFQVLHNAAWRNADLPDRSRPGERGRPPLAVNLSYMLTAYGDGAPEANDHRVLGRAMQYLNDHPLLFPADIHANAPASGLDTQIERVRFVPRTLTPEDMSRMWGTFMTQYRLSTVYDAAVVLIESTLPVSAGNPVVRRGDEDAGVIAQAGVPPFLTEVVAPELLRRGGQSTRQPAARIGDTLTIDGDRLTASGAMLEVRSPAWEPRWAGLGDLVPGARPETLTTTLIDPPPEPEPPAGTPAPLAWAPGVYSAAVRIRRSGVPDVSSNAVPIAIAPRITVAPLTAPAGDVDLTIDCLPPPRAGQRVLLILAGREPITPASITPPAGAGAPAVVKCHAAALTPGEYLVRLRVDGIDSLPYRASSPGPAGPPVRLEYDPQQKVVIT